MALLDVQSNQLAEMESSVNHLAQVCDVTLFDIRLQLAASSKILYNVSSSG